jgi:hypothetical protein
MSVTVVNDWYFLKDADMDEAMRAIREYMDHLTANEPELEQSLWLKTNDDPRRHFHIATYGTQESLDRANKIRRHQKVCREAISIDRSGFRGYACRTGYSQYGNRSR